MTALQTVRESGGYAWPGGYPVAAIMDDGALLCYSCTIDPTNPVHENANIADGWQVVGYDVFEGSEVDYEWTTCAHCYRNILEEE